MARWPDRLRTKTERACFADYFRMIEDIGAEPPTEPVIEEPAEIWQHLKIMSVRAHGRDWVVVYADPEWSPEEQHEWCVKGERLAYVGQFLGYDPPAYLDEESEVLEDCEEIIERLGHVPQGW